MSQSYECLYPFILPGVPTSLEYTNSTIYKKDPIKRGKLTFPKLVGPLCIWSHSHFLERTLLSFIQEQSAIFTSTFCFDKLFSLVCSI